MTTMADLTTEECEKHEIINCGMCKDAAKPKPAVTEHKSTGGFRSVRSLEIVAQFDSTCPRCEDDIVEGMTIIHSEAFDAFVHPNC